MLILEQETENFWSDTYCGRPIAILNRGSGWHVYLDHVLLHNMMFESAEKAVAWLVNRIDQDNVLNRGPTLNRTRCETRQVPIMRAARRRRSKSGKAVRSARYGVLKPSVSRELNSSP
jgi:hypothetical protein